MSTLPEATAAAGTLGAVAAALTVAFSKWLDSTRSDRREEYRLRRESDNVMKTELHDCQMECNRLRERNAALLADKAYLRGIISAHGMKTSRFDDDLSKDPT